MEKPALIFGMGRRALGEGLSEERKVKIITHPCALS